MEYFASERVKHVRDFRARTEIKGHENLSIYLVLEALICEHMDELSLCSVLN